MIQWNRAIDIFHCVCLMLHYYTHLKWLYCYYCVDMLNVYWGKKRPNRMNEIVRYTVISFSVGFSILFFFFYSLSNISFSCRIVWYKNLNVFMNRICATSEISTCMHIVSSLVSRTDVKPLVWYHDITQERPHISNASNVLVRVYWKAEFSSHRMRKKSKCIGAMCNSMGRQQQQPSTEPRVPLNSPSYTRNHIQPWPIRMLSAFYTCSRNQQM